MTKHIATGAELKQMESCPWLTDRERRAFNLYYRRGMHIEDVAAELDVSRRTVDYALRSLREKTLRQ